MNNPIPFTAIFPESFLTHQNQLILEPHSVPTCIDLQILGDCIGREQELKTILENLGVLEKQTFHSFRFQKRKTEWLGGRLCAKQSVTDYIQKFDSDQIIPSADELIINSLENGRPIIQHHQLAAAVDIPDISISHCHRYAMAMASKTFCGIDIQEMRPSLENVQEKFCHSEEQNLLSGLRFEKDSGPLIPLTLLWAVKEAVRKALSRVRLIGFLEITCQDIQLIDTNIWLFVINVADIGKQSIRLNVPALLKDEFGIGICQLPHSLQITLNNMEENNA